ncbi:MAG: DUF488 domain-containing protein [Candidatus Obscuribacterales bacterium]|nr:DUF488 domain-containing protein [Candidatus Obscuribacterales bacterium]
MMQQTDEVEGIRLLTVGHSIYPMLDFIELIRLHGIEVIVDVRSNPYSRYATHFHGPLLKKSLAEKHLKYVFLGAELGGKPKEQEFYDQDGHLNYERLANSTKFKTGMDRLEKGLSLYRVAIMCGEEDPGNCHRHLLISKVAIQKGYKVSHIRKGGTLQSYEELLALEEESDGHTQLTLFGESSEKQKANRRSRSRIRD